MHSQYNETTMANNIAIIQFSNPSVITVDSQMTMYDPALSLIQYSQITLERSMRQWDKVYATQFEAPVSQGCADYSAVYAQNPNLFVCTTARGSFSTANYKVPYGVATVEDAAKEKYVYALYSHSVMDNATLDGAQNVYSYYTVLSNYAAFAHSILGIDVKFLSNNAFQSVQIQTDPQVNVDITSGAAGTKDGVLVSGNLYSRDDEQKPAIVEITMETPDVSTENQSEENGSTDTTENATAEKNNAKKKKGLSTGAIVGIAIGASLMGLLAIIIGIRYAREVARRRSAERYWEREVRNLRSAKDLSQLTETDA
ncbi:hypothetical protein GGI05_004683 [Coemansia sp. RSA 2603]|nr:hypothetical protein GGI05_004683 [Coemansia sp. RSA 2603]